MKIIQAIAALGEDGLDAIRDEAMKTGLDFHKLVVSKALQKPYENVTSAERSEAKEHLFAYLYSARFPIRQYEMRIDERIFWMALGEAGRAFHTFGKVEITGRVREASGVLRGITPEERVQIAELAGPESVVNDASSSSES